MKHVFFIATFLVLCSHFSYAKIWRVNNNPGVDADFTNLNAAHTGAADGDTLHLEGSPNSYGGATITKKLVILGTGYFLDENPDSQAWLQSSKVDHITLYAGAAGTVIMGLDFRANGITVQSHDIVIRRNKFSSPNGNTQDWSTGTISLYTLHNNGNIPVTNVVITQNYGLRIDVNYASTGILIANNFLAYGSHAGESTTAQSLVMNANAIAIIQNNILRRGRITVYNSTVTNNIMLAGTFEGTGNLVANNLGNATQFGTTNGNQSNVDMTTVFLGAGSGISTDGQWKLKAGSPAIGAGYGHTAQNPVDAGMYSGGTPYVLAGLPPIPAIYYFENKPIGSNTDPISVTIKVKSVN
jgi:hypothetical protein